MSERIASTPDSPVCIHTAQIIDCCLDKDCIEDLRVYLTESSQSALDTATGEPNSPTKTGYSLGPNEIRSVYRLNTTAAPTPMSGVSTTRHSVPTTISFIIPFAAEKTNWPPSTISARGVVQLFSCESTVYKNGR